MDSTCVISQETGGGEIRSLKLFPLANTSASVVCVRLHLWERQCWCSAVANFEGGDCLMERGRGWGGGVGVYKPKEEAGGVARG